MEFDILDKTPTSPTTEILLIPAPCCCSREKQVFENQSFWNVLFIVGLCDCILDWSSGLLTQGVIMLCWFLVRTRNHKTSYHGFQNATESTNSIQDIGASSQLALLFIILHFFCDRRQIWKARRGNLELTAFGNRGSASCADSFPLLTYMTNKKDNMTNMKDTGKKSGINGIWKQRRFRPPASIASPWQRHSCTAFYLVRPALLLTNVTKMRKMVCV